MPGLLYMHVCACVCVCVYACACTHCMHVCMYVPTSLGFKFGLKQAIQIFYVAI